MECVIDRDIVLCDDSQADKEQGKGGLFPIGNTSSWSRSEIHSLQTLCLVGVGDSDMSAFPL